MTAHLGIQRASKEDSYPLVEEIVEACSDAKGIDTAVLDVSGAFDLSDYFVVVSGRSDRHVQGICNRISANLKDTNYRLLSLEGYDDGHWVLMDFGDVVVHVFYEPLRPHYDIEGLWLNATQLNAEEILEKKPKRKRAA